MPLLDTFSGEASPVNLSLHTSDSGHSWTQLLTGGVAGLVAPSGALYNEGASASNVAAYTSSWSPSSANYEVTATVRVVTDSGRFGIMARASGTSDATSTYYLGLYDVVYHNFQLWVCTNNSFGSLGSGASWSASLATGDTLTLRVSGSTISFKKNGTTVLGPYTNTGITGAGKAGTWCSGAMSATTGIWTDQIQAAELTIPLVTHRGRLVNAGGMGPVTRASIVNAGGP